jgi:hypothetical protein
MIRLLAHPLLPLSSANFLSLIFFSETGAPYVLVLKKQIINFINIFQLFDLASSSSGALGQRFVLIDSV